MGSEKTALVLGGGGTLGAVQASFIRRLAELAVPIDLVVGTSVGALNAAYVAFHQPSDHDCLHDIWAGLQRRRLYGRNPLQVLRNLATGRLALYDHDLVRSLVAAHVPSDDFAAARIPLAITAANLCTGQRHVFREGSIMQAIQASTAIPGVFAPVRIGPDLLVDGGVVAGLDIETAVSLGATQVIAVDLRPSLPTRCPRNIVEVITRSLEVLAESRSVCSAEHVQYPGVRIAHIRPGLSSTQRGTFRDVDDLLAGAYRFACDVLDNCWDRGLVVLGHYHGEAIEPRSPVAIENASAG